MRLYRRIITVYTDVPMEEESVSDVVTFAENGGGYILAEDPEEVELDDDPLVEDLRAVFVSEIQ